MTSIYGGIAGDNAKKLAPNLMLVIPRVGDKRGSDLFLADRLPNNARGLSSTSGADNDAIRR